MQSYTRDHAYLEGVQKGSRAHNQAVLAAWSEMETEVSYSIVVTIVC
jgi:hypothetical protein